VGEEDVPGDLDLDVARAVVTSRVTSDASAAELVAHTRVLEGLRRTASANRGTAGSERAELKLDNWR
jgi:hypothetical protein